MIDVSDTVLLILACAAVTYLTRIGGHLVLSRITTLNHRAEAALSAVPTAVLTALVAPYAVSNSVPEAFAIAAAVLVATRFSLMLSVVAGLVLLAALRFAIT